MKKIFCIIAFVAPFVLAGCSDDVPSNQNQTKKTAGTPLTPFGPSPVDNSNQLYTPTKDPLAPNPVAPPSVAPPPAAPQPLPKPPIDYANGDYFDAEYYLAKYPDLRAAFGTDIFQAKNHWLTYGINEGRQAKYSFSTVEYLAMYKDVAQVYGANNYRGALDHYYNYGANEGRVGRFGLRPEVFNAAWYLNHYPDLVQAFGANLELARQHWFNYGINEGRQATPGFSAAVYLNRYPDLLAAFGAGNYAAAIQHYFVYGIGEGRTGNP